MTTLDVVPPELLAELFAQATLHDHLAPVLLSHVSRRWREAAISNTSLWSKVRVILKPTNRMTTLLLVGTYIARSQQYPLNITFVDAGYGWPPDTLKQDEGCTKQIFEILVGQSNRWRELGFTSSTPQGPTYLSRLLQSPAPLLRYLSIQVLGCQHAEFQAVSRFVESSTALSCLSLDFRVQRERDTPLLTLGAPLHSLTHLMLKDWHSPSTLLAMLRCCTSLRFLSILDLSAAHDIPLAHVGVKHAVHLPDLREIYIYQQQLNQSLSIIFNNTICPSLSRLDVSCGFVEDVKWPDEAFDAFLQHSACPLTSLLLEMVQITEPQLIRCLEACSTTLQCLEVIEPRDVFCVQDELLHRLKSGKEHHNAPYGGCATLCPKLRTLRIRDAVLCRDGALSEFLQSRERPFLERLGCRRCLPLEEVKIRIRIKFRDALEKDIGYLRANGGFSQ